MDDEVFRGFPSTLAFGYTQIPNSWFDILLRIDNMAELKVVTYVIRHTWGYRDEDGERDTTKKITTDEFAYGRVRHDGSRMDSGTGMGLTTVKDGVKRALTHGYLTCEIDNTDLARIKKCYALKMLEDFADSRNPTISNRNPTISGHNATTDGPETDERSWKETSDANSSKETERRRMPSRSQFSQQALAFLEKKGTATFYELEQYLHRFMRVRGDSHIFLTKIKNGIIWNGVSSEYCDVCCDIQEDRHVQYEFSSEDKYKRRRPRMPVATSFEDHNEPQWHPMCIVYKREEQA